MNERIGYPDLLTNAEELSKEYDSVIIHVHYHSSLQLSTELK